jgi:hypothetical protein
MAAGTWSGWSTLPGQSRDAASGVPAVVTGPGGTDVLARTNTGALEHWHQQPGSAAWTGPEQLGSGLRSDPVAADDPTTGQLEVFAVLTGGNTVMTRQAAGGNQAAWSDWAPTGLTATSSLALLVTLSQTYVFARQANATIAGIAGAPETGWSPIQLPGSF